MNNLTEALIERKKYYLDCIAKIDAVLGVEEGGSIGARQEKPLNMKTEILCVMDGATDCMSAAGIAEKISSVNPTHIIDCAVVERVCYKLAKRGLITWFEGGNKFGPNWMVSKFTTTGKGCINLFDQKINQRNPISSGFTMQPHAVSTEIGDDYYKNKILKIINESPEPVSMEQITEMLVKSIPMIVSKSANVEIVRKWLDTLCSYHEIEFKMSDSNTFVYYKKPAFR